MKFCQICGSQLHDLAEICPKCGVRCELDKTVSSTSIQGSLGYSNFSGGLLGLIGINILFFLIVLFTLGISIPWGICVKESWYAKHTTIDDKQLIFTGTGLQLLGQYIIWLLLTIITLGIYSFWFSIKMKQWVIKHTHFR